MYTYIAIILIKNFPHQVAVEAPRPARWLLATSEYASAEGCLCRMLFSSLLTGGLNISAQTRPDTNTTRRSARAVSQALL